MLTADRVHWRKSNGKSTSSITSKMQDILLKKENLKNHIAMNSLRLDLKDLVRLN
jgi:hypothetical protein